MVLRGAPFNFADMRFTGQFQKNTPTVDAGGGQTDSYATVITTRVYLQKLRGNSGFPEGKMEYFKGYVLKCRFQQAFQTLGIDSDCQWLINGETYMVDDWELVDQTPQYYIMTVLKNQQ